MPLDIDDSNITETGIRGSPRISSSAPPTTVTYAIHAFRYRSLQGCIQTAIYSDLTLRDPGIANARVQELSAELDQLQASAPPPIKAGPGGALSLFMTPDWYQINHDYVTLQLYRFQLTDSKNPPPDNVVTKCMHAAKSICNGFRRQFIGKPTTYTWAVLHELFLSGLTYLYCLWTSPMARETTRQDQVSSTCTDCTMILVILAERWTDAAPYRDVFEALANRTMTMLADKQQGKEVAPDWLVTEEDQYSASFPQWMAGIADSEISLGLDLILNDLINDVPPPGQNNDVEGSAEGKETSSLYPIS